MKIIIPILGFAAQGGYRVLSELANAWIRRGHECIFLVPSTSAAPYFPTKASFLRCDRRGRFTNDRSGKAPSGADNLLSLWAGLRKIGHHYDVVLANHSLTAWPVFAANCGRALKLYYVQAYEPDYYRLSKKPFKHLLARTSYLLNLQQIANSASYRGAGLRPVAIIPPGIDLSVFTVKKPDVNFEAKDRIVLGTIGRTEPYKGTATAISSYRSLRQTEPRLHMKIGFGNVAPADDLEIVPIKGDAQLAAFYRSVDVLVVACYGQHGAPHYPLIEAMASGTPVVHTGYYPGSPENSWQAYDSSVEGLTAALWDLFRTPVAERARRIAAARETVARTLSWDAVAQQLEESFEKLRDFG